MSECAIIELDLINSCIKNWDWIWSSNKCPVGERFLEMTFPFLSSPKTGSMSSIPMCSSLSWATGASFRSSSLWSLWWEKNSIFSSFYWSGGIILLRILRIARHCRRVVISYEWVYFFKVFIFEWKLLKFSSLANRALDNRKLVLPVFVVDVLV